jgi:SWI/SNF-related matrix-associated actin-dependent regulator 1 of chromatin subfamily A
MVKMPFGEHMDYSGSSHLTELHVLLKKFLLVRRQKADVLKQLPSKRRQTVSLDIPASKLSKLRQMREEHEQLMGGELDRGKSNPHLTKYFKMTGVAKASSVCEYIDELIESGIKFLLYAHHIEVLDQLEDFVRNHKKFTAYMRIDGSTPPIKRDENVKQFQNEPECTVAILSITAAGSGLTLTAASHVVMAELNWTPAILVQAEDRVHRQ